MVRGIHAHRQTTKIRNRRTKAEILEEKRRRRENEQILNQIEAGIEQNSSESDGEENFNIEFQIAPNDENNENIRFTNEIKIIDFTYKSKNISIKFDLNYSREEPNEVQPEMLHQIQFDLEPAIITLFNGSRLSKMEAVQLLQSYRQRFVMSDASFEKLLDVLHSMLLPGGYCYII